MVAVALFTFSVYTLLIYIVSWYSVGALLALLAVSLWRMSVFIGEQNVQ